jgi:SOS-response transcriptional repressor LexA
MTAGQETVLMAQRAAPRPELMAWAAWFNGQLGRHGWNGMDFGTRAGVSHAAISRWRRALDRPRAAMAGRIAETFGVSVDEVLEAAGFRDSQAPPVPPAEPLLSQELLGTMLPLQHLAGRLQAIEARMARVPIVGDSAAADASRLLAPGDDDAAASVWVVRSALGGLRGVAVRVVGTCLAPAIRDGDVCVLALYEDAASVRWRDGDYVAAQVDGQEGLQLKRLTKVDDRWELRPHDDGAVIAVTAAVHIVGRVVQSGRQYE